MSPIGGSRLTKYIPSLVLFCNKAVGQLPGDEVTDPQRRILPSDGKLFFLPIFLGWE